jgi:hypothetical protein
MDFEKEVIEKYPHFANDNRLVKSLVAKAKMFYYGLKYPNEPLANETDNPIVGFVAQQWILSAVDEMVERLGFNSSVGYKENGTVWTLDGAQLSNRLVSLIVPIVGVISI